MSRTNTVGAASKAAAQVHTPTTTRTGKSLLTCGIIAGPFYVVVSLTQAWTREGFDLTRHAWSMLANGSLGWIQTANLMLTGLLVVAGAVGLRRVLAQGAQGAPGAPGTGSTWAPRMLSAYGLSMVGAGVFRADPALGFPPGTPRTGTSTSWHGMLHFVSGGVGFACLVVACFVLAHRFASSGLRRWAVFSRTTGVHGLVALMELHGSRLPARTDASGQPVLLFDQDRRLWERLLIRRGLGALDRAESLGGGTYTLQAAIAACHARGHSAEETDWPRIAALYEVLAFIQPSPVILLNRAVAVGMADGPERGLALVDELTDERALKNYPQFPAVRGELLELMGRHAEARAEFARAARLTHNKAERNLFLTRADAPGHRARP